MFEAFRPTKKEKEKTPSTDSKKSEKGMTRRSFLKVAAIGTAMVEVGLLASHPDVKRGVKEFLRKEEIEKEIDERQKRIKEKWGINVYFTPMDKLEMREGDEGQELSLLQKKDSLEWIEQELIKYPPLFFTDVVSIEYIRIVNQLKSKGRDAAGCAPRAGWRNDSENRGVILEYRSELNEFFDAEEVDQAGFKEHFHHEIMHKADFFTPIENTAIWAPLNPEGGKAYYRDGKMREQVKFKKGFAREYGQENEGEDKATIYQKMAMKHGRLMEYCRNKQDGILENKIKFLKTMFFYCTYGLMDEDYWDISDRNGIDEKYFQRKAEEIISLPSEQLARKYKKMKEGLPDANARVFRLEEDDFDEIKSILREKYPLSEVANSK